MTRALVPSGGFMLRTPLLPAAVVTRLGEGLAAAAFAGERADEPGLAEAVTADAAVVAERLRALLADPVVREAIWVASPSLSEQADRWLTGEKTEPGIVRALLSYVLRMSTRCTPFGLFAACSAGEVGPDLALRLAGTYDVARTTRLDYGFLAGLVADVEADPEARSALTFTPNTSLYRAGGRLRMAERAVGGGTIRYHRVTFEEDEPLAAALGRAAGGVRLDDLAETFVDGDVTADDARDYLDALVGSQVLESELSPLVTGGDPTPVLVAQLMAHPATKRVGEELDAARASIAAIDARVGNDPAAYHAVADGLRTVAGDVNVGRLFQVDLARPAPGLTLSDAIAAELVRVIETLHRIYPSGGETELDTFRTAFHERFEDREVPLVVALDEELGVGFGPSAGPSAEGAPLLADLEPAADTERAGKWERRDSHLLSLLLEARTAGSNEIRLTEADLAILANPSPPPLPDAVGVTAAIAAASHEAAANGDFRLLVSKASGPSGVNMLGRFCHLDPAIEAIVRRHVAAEEAFDPDATYAEIVHLPEGRVGNIIARPVLRSAEIAFLGRSGADERIPLTDLLVSIRDGGIRLRSARTGRRIVPRLTNSHYFQRGAMAAYRFLASLQYDRRAASLSWRWGPLTNARSLPRVVLGRTVLERASWAVGPRELEPVIKAGTPAETFRAVQAMRERRRLPGRFVVAASDNELTVDVDTVAGCELLAHEARRGSGLRLVERFPDFDDLCVESAEGAFFHEIVVPFVKPAPPPPAATTAPRRVAVAPAPEGFAASFPPGSEWLSTKLYCGQASTDAVIRGVVAPVAAAALRDGDGWFFLRYRDPQPHVRLRLHGPADRVAGDVLPLLRRVAAPFIESGLVWRTEVDTYTREVDRYGGPAGVLLAEQVFRADSEAALAVLLRTPDGVDGAAALGDRWRLALVAADRLFADLGFDVGARQVLARMQRDGLAAEFRGTGANARRLSGQIMRRERAGLDALLDGAAPAPGLAAGLAVLDRRSAALAAPIAELRALDAAGALTQPLPAIALSYNHMAVIRLLRGAPRLQELVIYDLLDRLYSARLGRAAGAR